MGNCATANKNRTSESIREKREQNLRNEIENFKSQELFHQALLKMAKLGSLLRISSKTSATPSGAYKEMVELYLEMGRMNQEIVGNHLKALQNYQIALEVSTQAFGPHNEVAQKVIQPLLLQNLAIVEEKMGPLQKQFFEGQLQNQHQQAEIQKAIVRSSTHATTRISCIPPSLNIIQEEPFEQDDQDEPKQSIN